MNENRKKWVKALRSGSFQQTTGSLRRIEPWVEKDVGYCCLGVACELYQQEVGGLNISNPGTGCLTYDGMTSYLPHLVREWLGIGEKFMQKLAWKNDNGYSFQAIANFIEDAEEVKL